MRVLIVGAGSAGQRHAVHAAALGHDARAYDVRRDRSNFASWVAAMAFAPEAAIIATPAQTHVTVALDLGRAGYGGPLLVEKPLSVSAQHAAFWRDWPHPTQMVGYNWRFHAQVRAWREVVPEGATYQLHCETDMQTWPGADYGDPALECSHELDVLRWLRAPEAPAVVASAARPAGRWYRFDSGDEVMTDWRARRAGRRFSARKGYAVVTCAPSLGEPLRESYRAMLREFLEAAAEARPVRAGASFADGVEAVRVVETARR